MSDHLVNLLIIGGGILLMGLFALTVSIRDEQRAKKYEQRKKDDKLDMIEEALRIMAKRDHRVKDALRQVGFYRRKS
ncbi:MAG: hypothetical protein M0Z75_02760 [Nitrospiraceae bacterium]|nr:hypothetical protein [Nitrospiraceae bacterium]MDA8090107.1 hypothetical protein [Nitrospiraceae bacterium]